METPSTQPEVEQTPNPAGRGILIIGTATLAVALVAGLILAARSTTEYPAGSPESAAQAYLQALLDEDPREARLYLAPELADACDSHEPYSWWIWNTDTIRFEDVRVDGDRAAIDLELSSIDDYDFLELPIDDPYRPARDAELVLERREGAWLVVEAAMPLHACDGR